MCPAPFLMNKSRRSTAPHLLSSEKPPKNGPLSWIQCYLFHLGSQGIVCLYLPLCQQLEYIAMRRKDTRALCLQASPSVDLTCVHLHLLRALVCSSSVQSWFQWILTPMHCCFVSELCHLPSFLPGPKHSIQLIAPEKEPPKLSWAGERCLHPQHLTLRWVVLRGSWGPFLSLLLMNSGAGP